MHAFLSSLDRHGRGGVIPYSDRDVSLDGLRGIAVLLVIGIHLGWVPFGWVGVQLFFVLSGFLITRILLEDRSRLRWGEYLRYFYRRRALRILPALYLYLAAVSLAAIWLQSFDALSERLLPAALFYSNYFVLLEGVQLNFSSWHDFATAHLWSLAVEEHFYLLWPLVVYAAGRKHLVKLACIVFAVGPALRWATVQGWLDPTVDGEVLKANAIYLMSTSHLDAFAAGALVALAPARVMAHLQSRGLLFASMAMFLCLACILVNVAAGHAWQTSLLSLGFPAFMGNAQQYLWGYSVLNALLAILLVQALAPGRLQEFLSQEVLTFVGRISYGLYLIHLPLLAIFIWLGRELLPADLHLRELILCIATPYLGCALGLAWLSFRYFEAPLLRFKRLGLPTAPDQGAARTLPPALLQTA